MKTLLTLATVMLLPAVCFAQYYQVSSPNNYAPNYAQPTPGYQPAPTGPMVPTPTLPNYGPTAPAPNMNYNAPGMAGGCDAGGCDMAGYGGGGCDASGCGPGMGGNYFGGGCGFDGGYGGGGCDTGCCSTGGCGGTYFTIFAGSVEMDDQRSVGYQRDLNIDFNQGYAIGGAFGRRVCRNLRMELEYTFRSQTADVVQFNGGFPGNVSGFQNSHAGMLNFAYDLIIGLGNIVPYVGGGIGVASVDSRVRYGTGVATLDGDDSGVAYQWMAGLSYRARPNMEMFVEYRFFEIDDPKLNRFGGPAIGTVAGGFTPNPNLLLESEYISQDIMFGMRFNY